jgi:N-succinyldiaminopimelate aminotransferase
MLEVLSDVGFRCVDPEGSYFILVDAVEAGFSDDVTAARTLVTEAGVAAIPSSSFYDPANADHRWLRFAFCKRESTMLEARRRLLANPLRRLAERAV